MNAVCVCRQYALLRWFRKPPRMSNAIGRLVLATLPYAVLIHTLVALFVYGDNDVLPSPPTRFTDPIYTERFHAALGALRDSRFDVMEISTILRRMSVFPSLVLLCALLVSYVVWKTMGGFITVVGKRLLWLITCGVLSSFDDGMVKERPMYTGPYLLRIPGVEGKEPVFDDIHARAGWQLIPDPTRPTGNMIQIKVWMTNGIMGGMRYRRGQRMLTWHVIHEQSLSTYNILMNPAYSAIMIAILEAHDRVRVCAVCAHVVPRSCALPRLSAALICGPVNTCVGRRGTVAPRVKPWPSPRRGRCLSRRCSRRRWRRWSPRWVRRHPRSPR
jgi:hypothetical protein